MKRAAHLETDYDNLVFCCSACNLSKSKISLCLKPHDDDISAHVMFRESGVAVGITRKGKSFIRTLSLNSDPRVKFRRRWIDIYKRAIRTGDRSEVIGWPEDLPDLSKSRPSSNRVNTKHCYFAIRKRQGLPELFVNERPVLEN